MRWGTRSRRVENTAEEHCRALCRGVQDSFTHRHRSQRMLQEAPADPDDIVLLREIRDSLQNR